MIHDLMSHTSIVLQNIVVLSIHRLGNLLCNGQDLCELVVGDIVEFCAVVLGDDELWKIGQKRIAKGKRAGKLTA